MGRVRWRSGEGEGGGGIAGYYEGLGALGEEEGGGGKSVTGDGLLGFFAVGESGGVAEVVEVGAGIEGEEGAEDGEAAETGIEDGDGGRGH